MNSLEVLYSVDSESEISNIKEAIEQVILQTEELIRNACYSAKFGELILKASIAMTEDERATLIDDIAEDLSRNVDIDIKDIITKELESAIDPEMFIEAAVLSRKMRKAAVAEKLGKKSSTISAASSKEISYIITINRQDAINASVSKKLSPSEFEGACKKILSEFYNAAWFEDFKGVSVENSDISKDLMSFVVKSTDKKKLDSFVEKVIKAYIIKFFNKQIGEIAVLSGKMRKATVAEKLGKKSSTISAASSNKEYMYRVVINEPNKYLAMTPSSKKAEVKGAFRNIKQSYVDSVKSEDSPYFGINISIDPASYKKEKNNLTLIISFNDKKVLDKYIKQIVEPVIKGNFKEANFEIKEL